ncbi:prefoldin subunit 4 [Apis laboriosa]|uniref:Prefoldin subunit 4 n=3 Tax=Apis TaxID=7459 RepID=A0A7M7GL97_APIME|nr:prefoldin subunit 4 [Apis mellifera]XP_006619880.1 prefoldin subunit 4 [Apis dorsata]XP_016911109.1 prefoldin subunit 4 [Apis cerana]XP_043784521.1 prefoldin subunit 4 [Apis laboriosa]KAG6799641.1 prefoldin subunit 4 [Apis mellifera caucasica]KAG9435582.1 prefoldin subunit 4 [Apis mellifera carnica]PBC30670.1 Prefoldin subunit [Apis cerana cerana]|eukprot:XP_006559044.1 prefoldin subunit 4 [Apis mellifera]
MSARKNVQTGFQPDSDVYITYEDQQKINKFARQNAKMDDLKEESKIKQNELKNLEDACDEISLLDEDAKIPYHIGEVFIYEDLERTQNYLDEIKEKKKKEISNLESKCIDLKNVITDLKTKLYAKFGSRINLEAEED